MTQNQISWDFLFLETVNSSCNTPKLLLRRVILSDALVKFQHISQGFWLDNFEGNMIEVVVLLLLYSSLNFPSLNERASIPSSDSFYSKIRGWCSKKKQSLLINKRYWDWFATMLYNSYIKILPCRVMVVDVHPFMGISLKMKISLPNTLVLVCYQWYAFFLSNIE